MKNRNTKLSARSLLAYGLVATAIVGTLATPAKADIGGCYSLKPICYSGHPACVCDITMHCWWGCV